MESKEIGVFVLVSGIEIIAEYTADKEFYLLKQPRRIIGQPAGPNKISIGLVPWVMSNPDGIFPVHSGHVVTVTAKIEDNILTNYFSQTTGIDMSAASSGNLVGV